MIERIEGHTQRMFRFGFANDRMAGESGDRSRRRRLMAVLRMAHRVLGFRRKGLGLGTLGAGGGLAAIAIGLATPAHAQYAAGGGTASAANAVAVGNGTQANGAASLALGTSNSATGDVRSPSAIR
ncbi:hypothetical protein AJ87_23535 [Rhizobium yanglingense]|nr:hypothetical protein AJ87_23535 [Rhizobium yanglingense]